MKMTVNQLIPALQMRLPQNQNRRKVHKVQKNPIQALPPVLQKQSQRPMQMLHVLIIVHHRLPLLGLS